MITRPLTPYEAFDGIPFSLGVEDLIADLGLPNRSRRNAVALNEYDYGHSVFRFQDCGRLEEITKRTPVLQVGAVAVPFGALRGFVMAQDAEAFERAGFTVSPRYGIAFVAEEPDWVTALARHCLPTWRALG